MIMDMHVEFYKVDEGRLCAWVATPPKRKPFQGTTMASGRDLPHDLAQFVVGHRAQHLVGVGGEAVGQQFGLFGGEAFELVE